MAAILAQNALTTLERVRADLGLSVTTNDDEIIRAVNSASALIEKYCHRIFWRDTAVEEKVAGFGTVEMRLARRPINSITSIVLDGETVDSDDYQVSDDQAGLVEKEGGWAWTAHVVQGISRTVVPGTELKDYVITYDGGWYTPAQSRAQGTLTFTGQPNDSETMVINNTTITAKTSGAATDEFDIGSSTRDTCDNLVAAINAGSESANVRAWRKNLTVVVEWLEGGTDGNTVIFTTSLTNTTADGSGTLGGTQTGIEQTLPEDLVDAASELARSMYLAKTRDPAVSSERLLSWSASYGASGGSGGGGSAMGIPLTVSRVIDQYKGLTI
jgi:hypothetical protein